MNQSVARRSPDERQRGFTLVEALVAIVILVFGLMAVTNLLLMAGSSNTVANQSTAATACATRVLEDLKGTSFDQLAAGGSLTTDVTNYSALDGVAGVGQIRTRWTISAVEGYTSATTGNPTAYFIVVQSEGTGVLAGARSRAEFTTFRTCTVQAC